VGGKSGRRVGKTDALKSQDRHRFYRLFAQPGFNLLNFDLVWARRATGAPFEYLS
jgi:hypothetical protein